MYVEGQPHMGNHVFRKRGRFGSCVAIVAGFLVVLVAGGVTQISEIDFGFVVFGYALLVVGILLVFGGEGSIFAVEALVINPSEQTLLWSRRRLFGRETRRIRFADLRAISSNIEIVGGEDGPTGMESYASIQVISGEPIELASHEDEKQTLLLAKRISELTGVAVEEESRQ